MEKRKYPLPAFLEGLHSQANYEKWLTNKAQTRLKRARDRGNTQANNEEYRIEIHRAVLECGGADAYTGELLDWRLLGRYNNVESKKGGRVYKKKFALLPTVDHVGDGMGKADFKICSWRTNDAKNDLSFSEFVVLCRQIISHNPNLSDEVIAVKGIDDIKSGKEVIKNTNQDSYQTMLDGIQAFHNKHDFKNHGGEDLAYRVALMAEELGEISSCVTKGKSKADLAEESADLLILLIGTAISADFDLNQAFWQKLEKINQRKSRIVNGKIRVSEFKGVTDE
ncbi:Protein export cytoplasm protein SecA ATPase RNA helicase (TC 3.A.5.1.1) [hydrothermal vent metagenome]|uniref:Protein export cytoplasm protein SecA ATPase RNA helicase (TC 3.A.5.1.1) n=1 Tax=hydrothermal vent metagenome TaxID=652676 RepID=A0A1W1E3Y8_9ZZZZ